MFRRVYDQNVEELFEVTNASPWWAIDVSRNADRLVVYSREEDIADEKIICICHDVERAGSSRQRSGVCRPGGCDAPESLARMLSIERQLGVKATYSVVGKLVPELREPIEMDGHCLAFHSYDHRISSSNGAAPTEDQLGRCRAVDYRLKGYRTPQSLITDELTDENLCFHNFEWLGSSTRSLGFDEPLAREQARKDSDSLR